MAAAGSSNVGASRAGWVAFCDEHTGEHHGMPVTGMTQPVAVSSSWENSVVDPAMLQRSSWVHFDEKPWTPSPPRPHPPSQVKGPRHSVCSSAGFWSSAPASEGAPSEELSSTSMDASSCDLPSLSTEEPPSHSSSPPHSAHSSICLEDEGINNMDALNWTSNITHTNGQTNTSRFANWVTFDDDDDDDNDDDDYVEEQAYQHAAKPSNIRIGNLNNLRLQDPNSNLIVSSIQNQRTERHILDLTPDGTDSVFVLESPLLNSSTPYSKKNPFLHEDFSNVQPSPINPFSDYFNKTALTSSDSHEKQETPPAFSFDSPVPNPDTQRDCSLFFSTAGNLDHGSGTGPTGFPCDGLDQFKNMQVSDPGQEPSLPDDSVDAGDDAEIPYEPAHMAPQDGWSMLLRIPEKKNIMSSRHWGPIYVRLSDAGKLRLYYEKGLEKHFKEFQLGVQLEISEHKTQHYEENSRVHTLSLDQVVYKEKRKIQPKVTVVHLPVKEQLVKLGTMDYQDFLSFRYALQEKLAVLSADVDAINSPMPYSEEEIQVEVIDRFYGVLSKGDNRILQQLVTTRVSVLAFLTGSPPCCIGLNDVQVKGKEVVSRHDIIPNTTTRWIRLRDCRLHECADEPEFTRSRTISFEPPSGRRFELLRFRTAYAEKTLPFTLRTVVSVRGAEVELQSWLVMSTGFSASRDPLTLIPCENVVIRYPIPDTWAKNFRRESVTGEKSLKARFNKGASFGSASTSGSEPAMRVTLGTAKYEQAFRAVVWRISRLPDKNSVSGQPHTFFCRLELGSDWEVPNKFQNVLEVEFDMPAASASKTSVRSLSVRDRAELKKWITYKAHYFYQVGMEQKNEGTEEQAGRCTQQ